MNLTVHDTNPGSEIATAGARTKAAASTRPIMRAGEWTTNSANGSAVVFKIAAMRKDTEIRARGDNLTPTIIEVKIGNDSMDAIHTAGRHPAADSTEDNSKAANMAGVSSAGRITASRDMAT